MKLTATTFYIGEILKGMVAAAPTAGPMTTALLCLTTGALRAGRSGTGGDLAQPTYPGYAPVVVDPTKWDLPATETDGSVTIVNSAPCHFRMTDATAPTTITGLALVVGPDPTDEVLASGLLDQPYSLIDATQAFRVVVTIGLPPGLWLGSPPIIG